MKKRLTLTAIAFLFMACLVTELKAQLSISIVNPNEVMKAEPVDDVVFTIQYELNYLVDTLNPEKRLDETMMLKVGKKNSVFYSYARYLTDSILEIDKKNGASQEVILNHMKMYTPKVGYKIYKNYPAGKLTYMDQLAIDRFVCQEKMEVPEWTILDDTLTIHNYSCNKAVCNLYGRTYEAWFTPDIPRSEGPWKLHGLPGVILKAEDTQGHYKFDCTGIALNRDNEDRIMYSAEGCQPISRKELNKLYARFAADPVAYLSSAAPNVTVTITSKDGTTPQKMVNTPFNPIEKE